MYDPKQDVFVSLFVSWFRLCFKTHHNQFSTLDNSKQNLQNSGQLVLLFCQMAAEQLACNVAMFVVPASELYLAVSLLLWKHNLIQQNDYYPDTILHCFAIYIIYYVLYIYCNINTEVGFFLIHILFSPVLWIMNWWKKKVMPSETLWKHVGKKKIFSMCETEWQKDIQNTFSSTYETKNLIFFPGMFFCWCGKQVLERDLKKIFFPHEHFYFLLNFFFSTWLHI